MRLFSIFFCRNVFFCWLVTFPLSALLLFYWYELSIYRFSLAEWQQPRLPAQASSWTRTSSWTWTRGSSSSTTASSSPRTKSKSSAKRQVFRRASAAASLHDQWRNHTPLLSFPFYRAPWKPADCEMHQAFQSWIWKNIKMDLEQNVRNGRSILKNRNSDNFGGHFVILRSENLGRKSVPSIPYSEYLKVPFRTALISKLS